mgnify:CR=1 FL=1
MPKVLFMNEVAAIIQCEYVPWMGDGEIEAANRLEATICRNCGIARDSNLRNQEVRNKAVCKCKKCQHEFVASFGGLIQCPKCTSSEVETVQMEFRLTCLSPHSPYLEPLKQKLKETGSP